MDGLNFTRRVETLLASRGIGKIQFYKDCGISDASFSQWKSGKFNPSGRSVKKVADYFKIPVSEFEQKEKPSPEWGEPIGNISGIPIIASVKAGYDGLAVEDDTGEYVQIPSVMLRGHSASECRAMHVRGDSMYPNMKDGDIVVVHIQSEVDNGKVAICIVNGDEGTIKRFFRYSDRVELWPDNPQVPKMVLKGQCLESFRVYGQAIALIREDL